MSTPYSPIVYAIAPNAPIGASFMIIADTPKITWPKRSTSVEQRLAALAEPVEREAEQEREQQHRQELAARERADERVGDDRRAGTR